jgi:uncharacterized membrane protein
VTLRRTLARIPADAWIVLLLLVAVQGAVLLAPGHPVRIVAALVGLLLLPGYALTTALFPATADRSAGLGTLRDSVITDTADSRAGVTVAERLALSFGLSVALLPLFAVILELAAGRLDPLGLFALVGLVVVAGLAAGTYRRLGTATDDRYRVQPAEWFVRIRRSVSTSSTRTVAVNALLVGAVVVAATSFAFALGAPQEGNSYTEVYVATDSGGDAAAADYPTELAAGESAELVFGLENREGAATTYSVVVQLQRLEDGQVVESTDLAGFGERVGDDEEWRHAHTIEPTDIGEKLRVAYLVYRGDPPADPSVDTAYRTLRFRINVTASA